MPKVWPLACSQLLAVFSFSSSAGIPVHALEESSDPGLHVRRDDSQLSTNSQRLPLSPDKATDHSENAVIDLSPFRIPHELDTDRIHKRESAYNQSIGLRDALIETVRYNLPIRISKESWNYQKYLLFANLSQFLPSFNLGYNLAESKISPGGITANAKVLSTQVTYPVFQGGSVLYNSLAQFYRNAGWRHAHQSNINDALLDVYNKYVELVQQDAILRIRAHSLSLSRLLLDLNTYMYQAGTATQFDVMQSRTQFSLDEDTFIQQQLTTRQAALELAYALNLPVSINLMAREPLLREAALFANAEKTTINDYVNLAIQNRPDLRQYEMFRLAAARTVQTAAAPLYPNVSFFTSYADTSVTSNDSSNSADSTLENAGVFTGTTKNFQAGINLTWTMSNLGMLNTANVVSARALSRQALVQANQELFQVMQQVRGYYDQIAIARNRIDAAASARASSKDALRFAHMRLKSGLGTNLELIQAQKSYINALIKQVQSITASNKAQAGLLHATGLITVDRLIDGYVQEKKPAKKGRLLRMF